MMPVEDRCSKCGGPRDWSVDTVLQDLCYSCGKVKIRPIMPEMTVNREMIREAMEYRVKHPTLEDLALLEQLHERRKELRMAAALEDRRQLQDALTEDIGRILASLDMPIDPHRTSWRDVIQERIKTDQRFLSTLRAFLHLVMDWIDADREACVRVANEAEAWVVAAEIRARGKM